MRRRPLSFSHTVQQCPSTKVLTRIWNKSSCGLNGLLGWITPPPRGPIIQRWFKLVLNLNRKMLYIIWVRIRCVMLCFSAPHISSGLTGSKLSHTSSESLALGCLQALGESRKLCLEHNKMTTSERAKWKVDVKESQWVQRVILFPQRGKQHQQGFKLRVQAFNKSDIQLPLGNRPGRLHHHFFVHHPGSPAKDSLTPLPR